MAVDRSTLFPIGADNVSCLRIAEWYGSDMGWEGGIAAMAVSVALASCGSGGSAPASSTGSTEEGQGCGDIALSCNQTVITLQSPNDAWASGTYTLALNIDGTPAHCLLPIPDPPPTNGAQGTCGVSAVMFSLTTVDSCPPVVCSNGVCGAMSCTPIPGRFQMTLKIGTGFGFTVSDAQPHVVGQLSVDLSVDGNALMNETIAPKATTTGSAACGFCTSASATLSIAGG